MNTEELTALLRTRYSGDQWAFLTQVPNGTGMAKDRTCDGLAMGLWPSKGLHLNGFEIKVSRSDWLKEIQDPSKANAFAVYCHHWWIVAPKGIVKLEEVAAEWGVQEVTDAGNLRVKKAASLRDPIDIDHCFLAAIFRSAFRQGTEAEIRTAYRKGRSDALDEERRRRKGQEETERQCANRELAALQTSVAEFQRASGIEIRSYGGGNLGELVATARAIRDGERELARIRERLERALAAIDSEKAEK